MKTSVAVVADSRLIHDDHAVMAVPWWSFTKTVMAAAALVLVAQRKLELDACVPGRPHILRHLLQHTAGVTNYGGLAAYHEAVARSDTPWPVDALLERCEADRLCFPPGQGWAYSNIGYLFVRQAIEQVSGEALGPALDRLVLNPLGIAGTRLALVRDDLREVGGVPSGYHPGWVYHGLLVGPLADAALLLDRLLAGDLLPPELRTAMTSPRRVGGPVEGRPWQEAAYGLGTMCGLVDGSRRVCGHTGGGPGSVIAVYRDAATGRTGSVFRDDSDDAAVEAAAFAAISRS